MRSFALIFSFIFSLNTVPSVAFAQDGELPGAVGRGGAYTCEISGAIALSSDAKRIDGQTLTGRGIATCRNDQGFTTDYPVVMKLTADTSIKELMSNSGVKAVAEPFVVNRDPNEMFDNYENYNMLHPKVAAELARSIQPVSVARGLASSRSITLHGAKNKLFMNMTLLGDPAALVALKIHSFSVEYDDQAPSLE